MPHHRHINMKTLILWVIPICVLVFKSFVFPETPRIKFGLSPQKQELYPDSERIWIRTGGPSGGLGYDVRIHPENKNIMFVTDNPSGVNKSYDAGLSWNQKNQGILVRTGPSFDGIPIFSLTIDPNNPDIIWAGTQGIKGIFKSTDCGETWVKKDNGVPGEKEISFRGFAVHPWYSEIVFAAAEKSTGIPGIEFDRTHGQIFKTVDGGEHWKQVWEGDNLARIILFDQESPDTLYASTGIFDREAVNIHGVGVLKSADGGETWFQINSGIPEDAGNRFIGYLEMHPSDSRILFAAAGNNVEGMGGIFRTLDGGNQWTKLLAGEVFTIVTISPSNPSILYAGGEHSFFRSVDFGESWQRMNGDDVIWGPEGIRAGFPISAVVDPFDPDIVFVNNYGGGNFVTQDGGLSWNNSSNGYTGANMYDIDIDPKNPGLVYSIGKSGPFMSRDGGTSWIGLAHSPADFPEWYAVAMNPKAPKEVIISTEHEGVLLKSLDRGMNWKKVFDHPLAHGEPAHRHGFKAISYAPSNPKIVYAGMCKGRRTIMGDFYAGRSFGMFKSTDGGETWNERNSGLDSTLLNIHCLAVNPLNEDIVYIGTWRDGVFKTQNGGQNWIPMNNGLLSSDVRSLAIDPRNTQTVYAGLGEGAGIYKSSNGGGLWQEATEGIDLQCPPYLMPFGRTKPGISLQTPKFRPFGAEYQGGVWTIIRDIEIDPADTQTIYAADQSTGVYVSQDGGIHWTPMNDGLTNRAVTSLVISSNGEVIYAATEGGGVFRMGDLNKVFRVPKPRDKIFPPKNGQIKK